MRLERGQRPDASRTLRGWSSRLRTRDRIAGQRAQAFAASRPALAYDVLRCCGSRCNACRRDVLPLARDCEAVANRQHDLLDAVVIPHEVVERDNGGGVAGRRRIEHPATPQRVVDRDDTGRPHPRHELGPVRRVPAFVGVDEREVETCCRGNELQCFQRWRRAELDAVCQRRPRCEERACDSTRTRRTYIATEQRADGSSPRAIANEEQPVNVPTSTAACTR